jgi:hypothetical protein
MIHQAIRREARLCHRKGNPALREAAVFDAKLVYRMHAPAFLQSDKRMSDSVKINILVISDHELPLQCEPVLVGSDLSAPIIRVTASAFMEQLVDRLASCVWR